MLALIRRRRSEGARRIGWKVGLTARAIQQQFGVHEPVFACLLAEGLVKSGHVFRSDALIEPGFENELCIVFDRDLPANATRADVAAAVAPVHPAFEIIETRGDLTGQLALALSDNGQQKAFVLGEPVSREELPELDMVTVRVRINDTEVATASGDAVLGHPYNSVAWLASKLTHFGERLSAGDYIMSGSFTRQFPLPAATASRRFSMVSARSQRALSDDSRSRRPRPETFEQRRGEPGSEVAVGAGNLVPKYSG